jgi:hypothetical protein
MPRQLVNVEEGAFELGGDDGVGASEVGLMRARGANRDRLSDTVLMP